MSPLRSLLFARIEAEPFLLSASLPHHDREHKKKPSLRVSLEAVGIALREAQREEARLRFLHSAVSQKFPTFPMTIALQQQIDYDVRGWKRRVGAHEVAGRPKSVLELYAPPLASPRCDFPSRRQPCHRQNATIISKLGVKRQERPA